MSSLVEVLNQIPLHNLIDEKGVIIVVSDEAAISKI